jgi:uncharacterized protein YqhQ
MWSGECPRRRKEGEKVEFTGPVAWTTIAVSLSFAVALFFLLPTFAARLLATYVNDDPMVDAIFEGVIRLVVFLIYLWLIGQFPTFARLRLSRRRTQDHQRL